VIGHQIGYAQGYTNINETVPVHEEVLSAEESTSASVGNMCYHMLNLSGK
jgi:hypothetical protein